MTIQIECGLIIPPDNSTRVVKTEDGIQIEYYDPAVRPRVTFYGVTEESKRETGKSNDARNEKLEKKLEDVIAEHFAPILHEKTLFRVNSGIARTFQIGG